MNYLVTTSIAAVKFITLEAAQDYVKKSLNHPDITMATINKIKA